MRIPPIMATMGFLRDFPLWYNVNADHSLPACFESVAVIAVI